MAKKTAAKKTTKKTRTIEAEFLDLWDACARQDQEILRAFRRVNETSSPSEELAAMREVNRLLEL